MSSLGIDFGGTYFKAAVLTADGQAQSVVRRAVPAFLDESGLAREIDPQAATDSLTSLLQQARVLEPRPDAILLTGQMGGLALVDEQGDAGAPLISWQDMRGTSVHELERALGGEELTRLGDPLRMGMPIVTLASMKVDPMLTPMSLIGFAAGQLCGRKAEIIHATDAASWGMVDVIQGDWSPAAIRAAGMSMDRLPKISHGVVPIGTFAFQNNDVPVYCGVGDQQASLLGAGLRPDVVSVNLATGCQVSLLSDDPHSPAQLRPYFDGTYLHTVTHLPAGRLLTAAVLKTRGALESSDWQWAAHEGLRAPAIAQAVSQIVAGITEAVDRLNARGRPLLFSGGLVQQFTPLREALLERLNTTGTVFEGEDASLSGLALLNQRLVHEK